MCNKWNGSWRLDKRVLTCLKHVNVIWHDDIEVKIIGLITISMKLCSTPKTLMLCKLGTCEPLLFVTQHKSYVEQILDQNNVHTK